MATRLRWWERWTPILLGPLVTLIVGGLVAYMIARANVNREYLGTAVTILTSQHANSDLRVFAVSLLEKFSPIPLGQKLSDGLKSGAVTIPAPPRSLSIPPLISPAPHGGGISPQCAGPSGNPKDPVRVGETITCTTAFTNSGRDTETIELAENIVRRPPAPDLSSGNLLVAPITLAPHQGIIVTYTHLVAPEDVTQGHFFVLGNVAGATRQPIGKKGQTVALPFSMGFPTMINAASP